jgi:phosphate acyltransferase
LRIQLRTPLRTPKLAQAPLNGTAVPHALTVTRLVVDVMGGDHGTSTTLPACKSFLDKHPDVEMVLVGSEDALASTRQWLRCTHVVATEVVTMEDAIEVALRRKRDSSMRVAIQQLREGAALQAHACVSSGNTGALMAISRFVLKTLDGIDRPAIAAVMPNRKGGYTTVLDLGANVDCAPENLLQFAVMGSALVAAVDGKPEPTVGLLNIGEEAIKGSEVTKLAGELLRSAGESGQIRFAGNVEGNDIYKGTVDVVVCDGFVGNVLLKTSEGLASMLSEMIKEEFGRTGLSKVAALISLPVLNRFKRRVDPRRYNGAALLGLRGLVFKSHGSADAYAFEQALARAYDAARNRLLDRVHERIGLTLPQTRTDSEADQAAKAPNAPVNGHGASAQERAA